MKLSVNEFREWENQCITLLGMSGVGKTRLANLLRKRNWFHYSGDYRIGTRYLDEPILDNIKQQAMQVPFLRDLLRSDSIYIRNNITVDNLKPVSSFLGKLGNPEQGRAAVSRSSSAARSCTAGGDRGHAGRAGVHPQGARDLRLPALRQRRRRQHLRTGRPGRDPALAEHTLILYIKATENDEQELIRRAEDDPKPLYYREAFLDEQLELYMSEKGCPTLRRSIPTISCAGCSRACSTRACRATQAIADANGYTVTTDELAGVRDEPVSCALVETAIARQGPPAVPRRRRISAMPLVAQLRSAQLSTA